MNNLFLKERLLLMLGEDSPGILLATAHELEQYFENITGIGVNAISTHSNMMLPSGKAVGPGQAAHCLREYNRTKVFWQGILQAIDDQLKHKRQIRVLYAGTGPYATLVTPLLTLLDPEQVRLDLLEINPVSLNAVKEIYQETGLDAFVDHYILADAATYQIPAGQAADIIISETMLAALRNEPQVAIMQNLVPQLSCGGVFIPQQINISAQLSNSRMEMAWMMGELDDPHYVFLQDIYTVSQVSLPGEAEVTVAIPANSGCNTLSLFTDIQVYKEHILTLNQCSLNMPVTVARVDDEPAINRVRFKYLLGEQPGFEISKF